MLQDLRARIARLEGSQADRAAPALSDATQVAAIDEDRCVLCGICASECPEGAILLEDTVRIDPGRCTGCGTCVNACPLELISLRKRDAAAS